MIGRAKKQKVKQEKERTPLQKYGRFIFWVVLVAVGILALLSAIRAGVAALGRALHSDTVAGAVMTTGQLAVAAAVLFAAVGLAVLVYRLSPYGRLRRKYGKDGFAGWWALRKHLSPRSMYKERKVLRPSLADVPRKHLSRVPLVGRTPVGRKLPPATELGSYLGTTRVGPLRPRKVYSGYKNVTILVAPPQSGKTALLAGAVIDAPGAVVSTSTKADVYKTTAVLRAERGPVWVFNPEGVGGVASNLRWDPVSGCRNPAVARERAGYLVQGSAGAKGATDHGFFEAQSAKVLRCLLMAAAFADRGMREVAAWVANPDDDTPVRILNHFRAQGVPHGWERELAQVVNMKADKTKDSIYATLSSAVEFMSDPHAAAIVDAGEAGSFDAEAFIRGRGTLYLLGHHRQSGGLAPLITAFTGMLFEAAKHMASFYPGGRLDPPVMLALDEAALITPVPLDQWGADAGGRGINLLVAFQSRAQIEARWGKEGRDTILDLANCRLYYGGMGVEDDVEAISRGIGERTVKTHSDTEHEKGGKSHSVGERQARIVPPERLRELPKLHVLLVERNSPPTIVKIRPYWKRADVKRVNKAAEKGVVDRQFLATEPEQASPEETAA